MEFLVTIININIIVWLFPPIKQFRRTFFYYFLVLAISDPLSILLIKTLGIKTVETFLILTCLLIVSILNPRTLKKIILISSLATIPIIFVYSYSVDVHTIRMILIILHIILFSIFAKNLVVDTAKNHALNFFYLFLAFYEATLLIKFFVMVLRVETGVVYFYFTSVFQLLFGLYFSLADEDKPLVKINLNTRKPEV